MATKKVKSAGRFGARYGKKLRAKVANIEAGQRRLQKCPYCNRQRARRLSLGVYFCRKCNSKFTSKAYKVE